MRVLDVFNILKPKKMSKEAQQPLESQETNTSLEGTSPETQATPEAPTAPEASTEEQTPTAVEDVPTGAGWQATRDYLSGDASGVELAVAALMERTATTHAVKVLENETEAGFTWELYLIHKSSLPTNRTMLTLRSLLPKGGTYGLHTVVMGTKEEVLAQIAAL